MISGKFPNIRFEHSFLPERQLTVVLGGKKIFDRKEEGGFPVKKPDFLERVEKAL